MMRLLALVPLSLSLGLSAQVQQTGAAMAQRPADSTARPTKRPAVELDVAAAGPSRQGGIFKLKGSASVPAGHVVDGSVVLLGGDAEIDGRVTGDVVVLGRSARILGTVTGDVVVVGPRAELGDRARIGGDFVTIGTAVIRSPDAVVEGETVALHGLRLLASILSLGSLLALAALWIQLISVLGWLFLAALAGFFLSRQLSESGARIGGRPVASFVAGVLFWPAVVLLFAAFVISIVGLPLTPVLGLAVASACVWGYLAAGQWIGEKIVRSAGGAIEARWVPCFAGVGFLQVLRWTPVVGKSLALAALVAGVGSTLLALGTKLAARPRPSDARPAAI